MNDTHIIDLISFTDTNNPFICSCNLDMHPCTDASGNFINEIKPDKMSFTCFLQQAVVRLSHRA